MGSPTRSASVTGGGSPGPAVRHPLSTPRSRCVSEGSVAVGDVHVLVVAHALGQAVPQDLQPPVAQSPQGGVVALSSGDFAVVELACPAASGEAAERPLVHCG